MDTSAIGQLPPVEQAHRGGHGGAHHAKFKAAQQTPANPKGDTVQISQAARLAAERAAREEAEARAAIGKDAQHRRNDRQASPDPDQPEQSETETPDPDQDRQAKA